MALSDIVPCDFCDESLNLNFCNDCYVRLCNECKIKHTGIGACKNLVPYKKRKLDCTRVCTVHKRDESNLLCKTCTLPICNMCLGRHKDHVLVVPIKFSTGRFKWLEALQYRFEELKLKEASGNFTFELCSNIAQEIEEILKNLLENDDKENPVFAFELSERNKIARLQREIVRLTAEIGTTKFIVKELKHEKEILQNHVGEIIRIMEDRETTIDKLQKNLTEEKKRKKEVQQANEGLRAEKYRELVYEFTKKSKMFEEYEKALKKINLQSSQMMRSLEEQKESVVTLQKTISEEEKKNKFELNRLGVPTTSKDQNPGMTDFSDPNRPLTPLKLAENVSELYDNEWTNAMESLESELNIEEEKGIEILINIFENVFHACAELGNNQFQSLSDVLIVPSVCIKKEKNSMLEVNNLPFEMLKSMKDFRKSHSKHAIIHLQKFFSTNEGKSKLQIKKKIFKTCEEYINKSIELCWMMRIQDPPFYMETEYPTNSEFDSNKMRPYTKAGKFVNFVVWPTFFLHKDGPLLARGVVQGSKTEIKDRKETTGDEECSSSSSYSYSDEFDDGFDDARSRTDSQPPGDNLNETTSEDEVRDLPEPN